MSEHSLSSRIDAWFAKDVHSTFYERIELLMRSQPLYQHLPYAERYGKTLRYILDGMTVFIQPGEKIVGSVKEIIPSAAQREYAEQRPRDWGD